MTTHDEVIERLTRVETKLDMLLASKRDGRATILSVAAMLVSLFCSGLVLKR